MTNKLYYGSISCAYLVDKKKDFYYANLFINMRSFKRILFSGFPITLEL